MAVWLSPAAAAATLGGNPVGAAAANSGGALPPEAETAAAAAAAANMPELNGWLLSCFMGEGPGLADVLGAEVGGGGSLWWFPGEAVFPLGDVKGAVCEVEVVTIPGTELGQITKKLI